MNNFSLLIVSIALSVLREEGVQDFGPYACVPGESLWRDLFLDA